MLLLVFDVMIADIMKPEINGCERLWIQVINLDRSDERLRAVASGLNAARIHWSRLRAIEPPVHNYLDHPLYNKTGVRRYLGADLRRGEIGCFLSHMEALKHFLSSGAELTLVLEDDADFSGVDLIAFNEIVDELLEMPQSSWACLNLTEVYVKWRDLLRETERWTLYRAYYFPMLASGLVWSRAGAKNFLDFVRRRGIFLPVDQQIRFFLAQNGHGLSLDKPLIPLFGFSTTIADRDLSPRPAWFAKPNRRLHNYWHSFVCRLKMRARM